MTRSIAAAFFILLSLLVPAGALSQVKKPMPPEQKPPFGESLQALVVTTSGWDAVTGTARMLERKDARSEWKQVGDRFPVVVGRNGLGADSTALWEKNSGYITKHEGDGRAPAGLMPLTDAFGRAAKAEAVELPYTRLAENTECVDDVKSHHYNKIVNRMQVGIFDWKSSEKMLAVGDEYDLGVFVGYNSYPVVPGNGSCIFLHVWKDPSTGTSGCTAMEHRSIERVLGWLDPAKDPYLIQMPSDVYEHYRKPWNLPKIK
jgi:D-alanyl-D-alanine dipeptidase